MYIRTSIKEMFAATRTMTAFERRQAEFREWNRLLQENATAKRHESRAPLDPRLTITEMLALSRPEGVVVQTLARLERTSAKAARRFPIRLRPGNKSKEEIFGKLGLS